MLVNPREMQTVNIEYMGDKTIYHYSQDVSDVLNSNESLRKDEDTVRKPGEFERVASIPMVVWHLWETMGITSNQRELRKAIQRHKDELMVTNKRII